MAPFFTSVAASEASEPAASCEVATSLVRLLETARTEFERDREAAKASIARASALLQVEIDRYASAAGDRDAAFTGLTGWQVNRVRAYIDDHLDESIRVKDLSGVARRSEAHFSRAFKRTFGETPHAYLIRRRLDRAGHLMLASDALLSEIALACGFADQAHFSKLFRQVTGQSPAAWRRERREASGTLPPSPAAVASLPRRAIVDRQSSWLDDDHDRPANKAA